MDDRIELRDYLRPKAKMDMIFAIVAIVLIVFSSILDLLFWKVNSSLNGKKILITLFTLFVITVIFLKYVFIGLSIRNIPSLFPFIMYAMAYALLKIRTYVIYNGNYTNGISIDTINFMSIIFGSLLFIGTIVYFVLFIMAKTKGVGHILVLATIGLTILNLIGYSILPKLVPYENQEIWQLIYAWDNIVFYTHSGALLSLAVSSLVANVMVMKSGKLMNKSLYISHTASNNVIDNMCNYIDTYGIREHQTTHMYVYFDETYGEYIVIRQDNITYLVKVEKIDGIYYPKDEDMIEIADNGGYQYSTFYTDEDSCLGKKGNMATLIAGLVTFGSVFLLAVLIEGFKIIRYIIDYIN